MKKFLIIVITAILILAIAGAGVYFFVPRDKSEQKNETFKLFSPDGSIIKYSADFTFISEGEYIFNTNEGYSVTVTSNKDNPEAFFNFKVDGENKHFINEKNLAIAFNIVQTETSFTITIAKDTSLTSVLETVYAGKTVEMPENMPCGKLFTLLIKSKDGKAERYVNFDVIKKLTIIMPEQVEF